MTGDSARAGTNVITAEHETADADAGCLIALLRRTPLAPAPEGWPRLFGSTADMDALRARALAIPGFAERIRARAEAAIADPAVFAAEPAWHFSAQEPIRTLATAAWITGEERFVSLATRLMDRAASAETWVAVVHRPMTCDHVAANVGATFACAMDLLAGRLTADHVRRYRAAVREKCLDPFLATARDRSAFWARRDCPSNWRIMTCGDAGTAALAFATEDEHAEIVAYAVEGVSDILDTIPDDGDFVEGPHYFVATLGMGLRFLAALERRWPEASRWLRHPRLARVADFLLHVTEPDGGTFDYFDNGVAWSAAERATTLLVARGERRGDLAALGRAGTPGSFFEIAYDDPSLASAAPSGPTVAHFRRSGLVACRSAWSPDATFAAFRVGPSAVGHSHLDAGSFVVSAGPARLAVDEGIWDYAHFLGFFDTAGRRWEFDANATVGHNALLVDGRGQVYGEHASGRIVAFEASEDGAYAVGDLAPAYGGLADECLRWFVWLPPRTALVFDRVRAAEPREVEWILHHRGEIAGDDAVWTLRSGEATLRVERLLRAADDPWRVSDVVRTTHYTESNRGTPRTPAIRYRSWGAIRRRTAHDIAIALTIGEDAPAIDARADGDRIEIAIDGCRVTILPGERAARIEPI